MKHTPENVLRILQRSGRHGLSLRQLRFFRQEGLLPPLTMGTKAGTNKREYFWAERDIVQQVAVLHDLLEEHSSRHEELLALLWLMGYTVPLERVQRLFLRMGERGVASLTPTEADEGDMYVLLWRLVRRWKFDPRPSSLTKQYGVVNVERVGELFFSILANVDFQVDEVVLASLSAGLLDRGAPPAGKPTDAQPPEAEEVAFAQQWVERIQSVVAFPVLLETIQQAPAEDWQWAIKSYRTAIKLLCAFLHLGSRFQQMPELDGWFLWRMLGLSGGLSIPILLSMQQRGYGHLIESGLLKMQEFFAELQAKVSDPAFQDQVSSEMSKWTSSEK